MKTKAERRENKRRKKRKMKVDGASVKDLQKLKLKLPDKFYSK